MDEVKYTLYREMEDGVVQKCLISCAMALALLVSGPALASVPENLNPVDIVTGERWMMSKQEEKLAYVLGIESAICIEHMINQKALELKTGAQTQLHNLSPFEKGWAQAFEHVTREDIVARVDSWLEAHPDQQKRPVLAIIWYELIAPNLPK